MTSDISHPKVWVRGLATRLPALVTVLGLMGGGALIYVPTKWVKPADIGVELLTSVYVSMGMTPPETSQIAGAATSPQQK